MWVVCSCKLVTPWFHWVTHPLQHHRWGPTTDVRHSRLIIRKKSKRVVHGINMPQAMNSRSILSSFDAYFARQYGQRWPSLRAAMAEPTNHIALLNLFSLVPVLEDLNRERRDLGRSQTDDRKVLDDDHVLKVPQGQLVPWSTNMVSNNNEEISPNLFADRRIRILEYISEANDPNMSAQNSVAKYPPPPADPSTNLMKWYWMDPASLVPPLALDIHPGHKVLDMCAAPGGKTLVIAHLLFSTSGPQGVSAGENNRLQTSQDSVETPNNSEKDGSSELAIDKLNVREESTDALSVGNNNLRISNEVKATEENSTNDVDRNSNVNEDSALGLQPVSNNKSLKSSSLVCNEIDSKRRSRLAGVLKSYLPSSLVQGGPVRITGHDGISWWSKNEEEKFDRILIDAPCSSDRHVVQQAAKRSHNSNVRSADWSEKRVKSIAKDQTKLLLAGLRALRVGGTLVYSTCSIAEAENDLVIEKALSKIEEDSCTFTPFKPSGSDGPTSVGPIPGAEKTRYGWLFLPDRTGWGPIYFTILKKTRSIQKRQKVNKYKKHSKVDN